MAIKIDPDKVMQSWSTLLPGQVNQEKKFFDLVQEELAKRRADLKWDFNDVGTMFGKKQEYLKVSGSDPSVFCLIGSQTLGIDLYLSWHVYTTKNLGKMIPQNTAQAAVIGLAGMFKSDFVELERIAAFASLVKDCVIEAVEKIYEAANLDKKKLNRQSSGVMGPI